MVSMYATKNHIAYITIRRCHLASNSKHSFFEQYKDEMPSEDPDDSIAKTALHKLQVCFFL